MYMSIYGIDNVRGGAFCSEELGGADKYIIDRKEIKDKFSDFEINNYIA